MKKLLTLLHFALASCILFAQSGSESFTSSGTFTVPDGVFAVTIEVVGAGGSGGGNGTGGGGGGGYASGTYTVLPLQVMYITVGTAGSGSFTGSTLVDELIVATGGVNGVSIPNPEIGGGGDGGQGSGGTIANYNGGNGGGGYYTYFGGGGGGAAGPSGNGSDGGNTIVWLGDCLTPGGDGGISGGAPGGNGGKGAGFIDGSCITTNPSEDGFDYGGGGGGGNGNGGGPGIGANGYCVISWDACDVDITTVTSTDTITANAEDAAYQWIDCNNGNVAIAGETSQMFVASETGSYAVIITEGTCVDTSACVDVEIETEAVHTMYADGIYAYPNPFTSTINIQNGRAEDVYTLLSVEGQIVYSGNDIVQKDLSAFNKGIYILKISNGSSAKYIVMMKE